MSGKKAVKLVPKPALMEDIELFFKPSSGKTKNDDENKRREQILVQMFQPTTETHNLSAYLSDPTYGEKWTLLEDRWRKTIRQLCHSPYYHSFQIEQMAGRGHNYDFKVTFYESADIILQVANVEFKHNSRSISSIPQFLSLNINTDILPETYAGFYYDNCLTEYCATDEVLAQEPKPTREQYLKLVTNVNHDCHPLFRLMYNREETNKEQKFEIVNRSIARFLELYGPTIDLPRLSDKFIQTQQNKVFAMWDLSNFHVEQFTPAELTVCRFSGISNGNTIVVESDTMKYKLLLRWRNHKGILNPAWQISLGDSIEMAEAKSARALQSAQDKLVKADAKLAKDQEKIAKTQEKLVKAQEKQAKIEAKLAKAQEKANIAQAKANYKNVVNI